MGFLAISKVPMFKKIQLVSFDKKYKFALVEEASMGSPNPVTGYFLELKDLSVNLVVSLRWVLWAYVFLSSLSRELDSLDPEYNWENLISESLSTGLNVHERTHILSLDEAEVTSEEGLFKLLETYKKDIFDENSKVHLKLRLNLREYLIISNVLYPVFVKWERDERFT